MARLLDEVRAVAPGSDPAERAARIARMVATADAGALQDLLFDEQVLSDLPEDVFQAMLRRLAREAAPWTSDYLRVLPDGALRGELLGTVMAQWSGEELPAALAWAQACDDSGLRGSALVHLSYRWFEADPEAALAYAALNPQENRQLLTNLVGLWSREQPEAAAEWAATFSTEAAMVGVTVNAVAQWARQDDLAAAEFVLSLPEGKLREEASISVMSSFARSDPETGAMWVDLFPAGTSRDYAIENLVYSWAVSDPEAALAWVSRLPTGERDTAIFAGAGGLIETRPELAAGWAMAIQDVTRRTQQSERVAQHWLKTDRWSAEAWIRRSSLPEQTKLRLLASASGGS